MQPAAVCPLITNDDGDITLIAKWSKTEVKLTLSIADYEDFTIGDLRLKIHEVLDIPTDKQRFLGIKGPSIKMSDDWKLVDIRFNTPFTFVLMGTSSSNAYQESPDDSNVIDDLEVKWFSWDIEASDLSNNNVRTASVERRLARAIRECKIEFQNSQIGDSTKPLLVLDLDFTLFDCTDYSEGTMEWRKRPYLSYFLKKVAPHYQMCVWSQTRRKWVEMKCRELGLLVDSSNSSVGKTPHPIAFLLDSSTMFTVNSNDNKGGVRSHQVKSLEVIWEASKGLYRKERTVHIDDLRRNFVLNPSNGIKVDGYRQDKREKDTDLYLLAEYLMHIKDAADMSALEHETWRETSWNLIKKRSEHIPNHVNLLNEETSLPGFTFEQ